MFFTSASLLTTGCLSLPDLRKASTLPAWPLYFSALFLNDGPSLSAETEWHLRQPFFFTAASPAALSCDCAAKGAASAAIASRTRICLIVLPVLLTRGVTSPQSRPRGYWTKVLWKRPGPH